MCIVCGSGAAHLSGALARTGGGGRFVAEAVASDRIPPLDPAHDDDLLGPADTILRGGPILTMTATAGPAEAVAVRAGRIQAVGRAEDVLAHRGRLTRVIDLEGRALLPGFINAHWHMNLGLLCDWVDLPAAASPDAACTTVAAAAQGAGIGEWIVLRGPVHPPSPAALAAAAPSHPVLAIDASGAILAGSQAAEPLAAHVSALLPRIASRLGVSATPLRQRLARLLKRAAAGGTTCLRVCGLGLLTGADDLDLLRAAAGVTPPLRLRGTLDAGLLAEWQRRRIVPGAGDDMLRVDAISAWLSTGPDAAALAAVRRAGWPVTLHVADEAGLQAALDILARAGFAADARCGIEARAMPGPAQMAVLQRAGVSLGLTLDESSASPAAMPAEITLSLGLDAVAGPSPPLHMLRAAISGRYGAPLDMPAALAALTEGAARRCGAGDILGRIVRAAYADFAFLDRDPRGLDADGLAALRCCGTWVNGIETFRA